MCSHSWTRVASISIRATPFVSQERKRYPEQGCRSTLSACSRVGARLQVGTTSEKPHSQLLTTLQQWPFGFLSSNVRFLLPACRCLQEISSYETEERGQSCSRKGVEDPKQTNLVDKVICGRSGDSRTPKLEVLGGGSTAIHCSRTRTNPNRRGAGSVVRGGRVLSVLHQQPQPLPQSGGGIPRATVELDH